MTDEELTDIRLRQVLVVTQAIFGQMPEKDRFAILEFIHSQKFVPVEECELLSEAERTDQTRQSLAITMAYDFLARVNDGLVFQDALDGLFDDNTDSDS